jgi:O-6-methylguanine DNA methyltransferase
MTQIVIDTSFGLITLMFDNHELVRVEQAQSKQSIGRISNDVLQPVIDCIEGRRDGLGIQLKVWDAMRLVPPGEVISYSELAKRAGNVRATRAAASACGQNPCAIIVPCHRVVRRDYRLGGFFWGMETKKTLLQREGLRIQGDQIIDSHHP